MQYKYTGKNPQAGVMFSLVYMDLHRSIDLSFLFQTTLRHI